MSETEDPAKEDFGYGWKFCRGDFDGAERAGFDDAGWEAATIPHTWNADDMFPGRTEAPYIGPAWYRKRFRATKPEDGGRLLLLFEAVANWSKVWVDGAYVGGYDGGFLSFRLDITDALAEGEEHVVAVRADTTPRSDLVPPEAIDWERYGGIYRRVWLERKAWAYFEHRGTLHGQFIVPKQKPTLLLFSRVVQTRSPSTWLNVRQRLLDPEGAEVAVADEWVSGLERSVRVGGMLSIETPLRMWSPDSPALYQLESTLFENGAELDRQSVPVGFRILRFDKDQGFSIDKTATKLLGVDMHQEYPGLGWAVPPRFHEEELRMLKAAGINFIRTSHYPRDEYVLDLCDRLGILVMEEQPFWHGSLRAKNGEAFITQARQAMRDMIQQHGNHPSVIIWNLVNEVILTPIPRMRHPEPGDPRPVLGKEEWPYAVRAITEMHNACKETDPQMRPTCVVVGGHWEDNDKAGTTRIADLVGYNGGAINGLSKGRLVIDIERERYPERCALMTEGVANDRPPMRADWEKESTHWEIHARHWENFYEREWFAGGAMWVWADYSANGRYRNMALVDFWRLPYEVYHFYRSQWTEEPMAHILTHWDWPGEEGKTRRVVVFTNGKSAGLFLNGKSLGKKKPRREKWKLLPHPPIEWEVEYQPGELRVVARGRKKQGGGEAPVPSEVEAPVPSRVEATDRRRTSGAPAEVVLKPEPDEIHADGRDVSFITATIVDAEGNRCYRADREIEITVSGAAKLAGPARLLA